MKRLRWYVWFRTATQPKNEWVRTHDSVHDNRPLVFSKRLGIETQPDFPFYTRTAARQEVNDRIRMFNEASGYECAFRRDYRVLPAGKRPK
jgi:hypothetical protein